jgi:hypothetical protein
MNRLDVLSRQLTGAHIAAVTLTPVTCALVFRYTKPTSQYHPADVYMAALPPCLQLAWLLRARHLPRAKTASPGLQARVSTGEVRIRLLALPPEYASRQAKHKLNYLFAHS